MSLPDYVNCDNTKIEHCDFFMKYDCKETCAYARDIMGTREEDFPQEELGIGAIVIPLEWRIR